ncbi:hypothetical protein GOP47_0021145 [Adiantum capillus-veneris]|uniref:Pentatricopeptide repeat-containing protein n=1 Tax=Adiantum capillus-veneris TaxID=13818 RepID=A0A9D4UAT9_ADICA|nr:hypothetical protein GOP47_0021145 [Adiantum capillus-veneris]
MRRAHATGRDISKLASLKEICGSLENGTIPVFSIKELSSVLDKCRRENDNSLAEQLHAYVRGCGFETDKVLGNVLVRLLVEVGYISDAQQLFDKLTYPDESSWNTLIKGCAKGRESEHALNLYKGLSGHETIQLWSSTFVALLKACADLKNFEVGSIIYADVARKGLLEQDVILGTTVVDMYAKCGFLTIAQEVFDNLLVRDVVSWTTLITGFVQRERGEDALLYFDSMQNTGIPPDDITFACCLQACGIAGNREKGQVVHNDIVAKGLEMDVVIANTLINMYSACGVLLDAQDVFDKLPRDVISWNTLLAGYVENSQYKEALSRFWQMKKEGISPQAVTLVCLLKACGSVGDIDRGRQIQSEVIKQDLETNPFIASALVDMYIKCGSLEKSQEVFNALPLRDAVCWTTLLTRYTENGLCERTLASFEKMHCEGISPVLATFISVLKACASLVALDKGWEVHAEVVLRGLEKDYVVGSTLLGLYSRCAQLNEAHYMFEALPFLDLVSWTTLISGQALVGDIESVFSTLQDMFGDGIEPGRVTCGHVLNACNHGGLTDEGVMFFGMLTTDLGSIPSSEHFTCMVDLFSRAGQIGMAAFVIKHMPRQPSAVVWHVVLAACQKWSNAEVGREAFEHAMLLDEDDYAAYVTISNIFADNIVDDDLQLIEAPYW